MKFDKATYVGPEPYRGQTVKMSNFWKPKIAAPTVLKMTKIRDISATVWPIFTKFGTLMQNGLLPVLTIKNLISKIQDGWRPPF